MGEGMNLGILLGVVNGIVILLLFVFYKTSAKKSLSIGEISGGVKEYLHMGVFGDTSNHMHRFCYAVAKLLNEAVKEVDEGQLNVPQLFDFNGHKNHVTLVAYPAGNENLVKTLQFLKAMDAVIMNISKEGPVDAMIVEKCYWARVMGIRRVIFYIWQKEDKPFEEEAWKQKLEPMITKCGFEMGSVSFVSGVINSGNGYDLDVLTPEPLIKELDTRVKKRYKDTKKPFLMPIHEVFNIVGKGQVITGLVEQGILKTGDFVELMGSGLDKRVKINSIEVYKKVLHIAYAGEVIGAVLDKTDKVIVKAGMVICSIGSQQQANDFEAGLYVLTAEEGGKGPDVKNLDKFTLYTRLGAMQVSMRMDTAIRMGGSGTVKLHFEMNMVLPSTSAFMLFSEAGMVAVGLTK